MYDWEPVIIPGDEMPDEIDSTSSSYYIYLRKDIVPYEEFDDDGQQTFKGWKYLEAKVPNVNYFNDVQIEQNEKIDALMLGMCDLYEIGIGEV